MRQCSRSCCVFCDVKRGFLDLIWGCCNSLHGSFCSKYLCKFLLLVVFNVLGNGLVQWGQTAGGQETGGRGSALPWHRRELGGTWILSWPGCLNSHGFSWRAPSFQCEFLTEQGKCFLWGGNPGWKSLKGALVGLTALPWKVTPSLGCTNCLERQTDKLTR